MTGENKDGYRKKRDSNAYHLLVPLFSSFTGSVVCHTLSLFVKSPFGIISFDFLYDSFTRALPLLSFSSLILICFYANLLCTINLWNQPCRACRYSRQYADALLTSLCSFIKVVDWCSGLTSRLELWLGGGAAGSIPRSAFVFCGGENVCVHSLCMGVGVRTCSIVSLHPVNRRR